MYTGSEEMSAMVAIHVGDEKAIRGFLFLVQNELGPVGLLDLADAHIDLEEVPGCVVMLPYSSALVTVEELDVDAPQLWGGTILAVYREDEPFVDGDFILEAGDLCQLLSLVAFEDEGDLVEQSDA